MTIAHLVYVPFVVLVGFFAGWSMGGRSMRGEMERAEKRRKSREGG